MVNQSAQVAAPAGNVSELQGISTAGIGPVGSMATPRCWPCAMAQSAKMITTVVSGLYIGARSASTLTIKISIRTRTKLRW